MYLCARLSFEMGTPPEHEHRQSGGLQRNASTRRSIFVSAAFRWTGPTWWMLRVSTRALSFKATTPTPAENQARAPQRPQLRWMVWVRSHSLLDRRRSASIVPPTVIDVRARRPDRNQAETASRNGTFSLKSPSLHRQVNNAACAASQLVFEPLLSWELYRA
jgi:hypothetical protein